MRAVLSVLLTHPNQVVSVDRFVDELWPDGGPAAARGQVHDYVSRLRRAFRSAPTEAPARRLVTRKPGYLLEVGEEELDRHRYERLLADARSARESNDLQTSLKCYREADRLWRGGPFSDVPPISSVVAAQTALAELRLISREEGYETALDLGVEEGLVTELSRLVEAYPLRERLVAQLMRALYRTGRTADALGLARRTRRRLAEEIGADPGPELRHRELAILRGEPDPPPPAARGRAGAAALAQLPADVPVFIGRRAELEQLRADPNGGPRGSHGPSITVIDGMPGVGKTALAVHAAHSLAPMYPDGQLFLDLHGHTEGLEPLEPGEALGSLLRRLGVSEPQMPPTVDERAALYRGLLTGRRMLIVLDNALASGQVAPLLPGAGGSMVIVTSRSRSTGFHHGRSLTLGAMPRDEAAELMRLSVPEDRIDDRTREHIAEAVDLCGALPLALVICASRLGAHSTWSFEYLVDSLRGWRRELMGADAPECPVMASVELSFQRLAPEERRLYRFLGIGSEPGVDAYEAAVLIGVEPDRARYLLDRLFEAHLLDEPAEGRYAFHELLRLHALRAAERDLSEAERRSAADRLREHRRRSRPVAAPPRR
ncbi:AfsR/SARP family transcriptional regulator [Glycomyces tenuis]|nr:AfsR/SARP family transcriptional regulator [Glycomyces tenuis]